MERATSRGLNGPSCQHTNNGKYSNGNFATRLLSTQCHSLTYGLEPFTPSFLIPFRLGGFIYGYIVIFYRQITSFNIIIFDLMTRGVLRQQLMISSTYTMFVYRADCLSV